MKKISLILFFMLFGQSALADMARVVDVKAQQQNGTWRFDVTIAHGDTGWDHYADGWGVYLPDGTELGYRILYHPHVNEQPFTRSLSDVVVPDGVTEVMIRPRDSVHGVGEAFPITLSDAPSQANQK